MYRQKIIGVIPARYQSTRFPGKIIADLCGKPMIQHVYERAKKSKILSDLIVACDDEKILKAVEKFGGTAVMTSVHHQSGTDRVAEVAKHKSCDGVVNIQGDEPLITGTMIDLVAQALLDGDVPMSTLARKMKNKDEIGDPNIVKVVCDLKGDAMYFSRAPIPYLRGEQGDWDWLKHIGLYGYQKDFLLKFALMRPTLLELTERLEQLRALENGVRIVVKITDEDSLGVDTPKDLEEVKKII